MSCATINFSLQSYEKTIWHCPNLSEFVRICQFLSVFGTMLFYGAKLRKVNLAMSVCVSLCQSMSLCVTLRSIASFSMQSYEKGFWHCHLLSLFVTFCHLSANCFFSLQSYEKGFCHCPHLSAYVRKCPHLSAFLFRCKVTQKKIVTVQLCPAMSICVHLCPATSSIYVAKLQNRNLAMSKFVQLCPNLSIFWTSSGFGESLRTYNNNAN